jgi:uncharacterized protein (DUF1778 family)
MMTAADLAATTSEVFMMSEMNRGAAAVVARAARFLATRTGGASG